MMTYPDITSISKEDLIRYPIRSFEGKIHVISKLQDAEQAVAELAQKPMLGFDTETRPSFSKSQSYSVALLQLSDENDAYLFQLKKIGMPLSLANILSSETIKKVGVAVHDDIRHLQGIRKFQPNNFTDLQTIAKLLQIDAMGLRRLTPLALGFRISKRQQLSNWENDRLTERQRLYAATDAWVSLKIYKQLLPYTL